LGRVLRSTLGGGFGMFFAVQGDHVRHLTLLIVIDGGLHVRFESSTCFDLLTMLQSLHCVQRLGGDAGSIMTVTVVRDTGVYPRRQVVNCIFENSLK